MKQHGLSPKLEARKSSADLNVITGYPLDSISSFNEARTDSSSSRTSTMNLPFAMMSLHLFGGDDGNRRQTKMGYRTSKSLFER